MLTLRAMTLEASISAPTQRAPGPVDEARAAELRAANINPRTGLATDYLNHFNEAVMLLEMVPDMPECAEDFLHWHRCPMPSTSPRPISRRGILRSRPMNPRTKKSAANSTTSPIR